MTQDTSMSDMLREAMEKKQGSKNSFTMTGQYTSPVQQEQGPSGENREFVMYDSPNGESVKVYGNWNEYAVSQDEEGNMVIGDEDYPIVENEKGEFILDEATLDGQQRGMEAGREAEGAPGASKMDDLMEMLGGMRGQGGEPAPGQEFDKGGRVRRRNSRQAGKELKYLARKRQLPAQGSEEQMAEEYRRRRNQRLLKALMGGVAGGVIGGGEYNVRQRRS
jgi:hypothetical protein